MRNCFPGQSRSNYSKSGHRLRSRGQLVTKFSGGDSLELAHSWMRPLT